MSNDLSPPNPDRFGIVSFSDFLPSRDPIIGEEPGSFDGFHEGMMASLAPITPYEAVIAENLIAIEWELPQHRRMREASMRRDIHNAIMDAVVKRHKSNFDDAVDDAWEEHLAIGGTEDDWEYPFEFDDDEAKKIGEDLVLRATSHEPNNQSEAYAEIQEMGMSPIEMMISAYVDYNRHSIKHDEKVRELERRRRDVMRDYQALQRSRPIEGEVVEG